ncbi:MAG: hypothetical protein WCO60_03710 [Verrucomicrobiota bacterium]
MQKRTKLLTFTLLLCGTLAGIYYPRQKHTQPEEQANPPETQKISEPTPVAAPEPPLPQITLESLQIERGNSRIATKLLNHLGKEKISERFGRYLNTPEENSQLERQHRALLQTISALLNHKNLSLNSLDNAFQLLKQAPVNDARMCDALANALYSILQAKQKNGAEIPVTAKNDYQDFLVQLFTQRRFQHLLLGAQFYNAIFKDTTTPLKLSPQIENLLGEYASVSTLEILAKESLQSSKTEGERLQSLLENNNLDTASKSLKKAFITSEFLPELRVLPLAQKKRILTYIKRNNELGSTLDLKDYAAAKSILQDLTELAADFDPAPIQSIIESTMKLAAINIEKAKLAVKSKNKADFQTAMRAAESLWPNNPALHEVLY